MKKTIVINIGNDKEVACHGECGNMLKLSDSGVVLVTCDNNIIGWYCSYECYVKYFQWLQGESTD
jgi:hypothetical protein